VPSGHVTELNVARLGDGSDFGLWRLNGHGTSVLAFTGGASAYYHFQYRHQPKCKRCDLSAVVQPRTPATNLLFEILIGYCVYDFLKSSVSKLNDESGFSISKPCHIKAIGTCLRSCPWLCPPLLSAIACCSGVGCKRQRKHTVDGLWLNPLPASTRRGGLRAPSKTPAPAAWVRSLQLRVLRLGLLQDGDAGVGVFPEG
jgi:hypothetical protein